MPKHRRTLEQVFEDPVRANIRWSDIESMLRSFGAEITSAEGSRTTVVLKGRRAVFHRLHPRPETDKGAVKSVRRFLQSVGVTP